MPRKATGTEFIERAQELLANAKSAMQVKQAQAVLFPLLFGLTIKQTAERIGLSLGWTSRLRSAFIKSSGTAKIDGRGGRNRQLMSKEEEANFLDTFVEKASRGGVIVVAEIRTALESHLNKTIALASVYNILHRNGWRKIMPDKQHPGSSPEIREGFKKNSQS